MNLRLRVRLLWGGSFLLLAESFRLVAKADNKPLACPPYSSVSSSIRILRSSSARSLPFKSDGRISTDSARA